MAIGAIGKDGYLDEIGERILRSLAASPSSSVREVATGLTVNRSTASKYLHLFRGKKRVHFRQTRWVKSWSLEEA